MKPPKTDNQQYIYNNFKTQIMELVKQKEEFCRTYTEEGSRDRLTHVKYNVVHQGQLVGDANVSTGGFVGIGISPSQRLHVAGNIYTSGDFICEKNSNYLSLDYNGLTMIASISLANELIKLKNENSELRSKLEKIELYLQERETA